MRGLFCLIEVFARTDALIRIWKNCDLRWMGVDAPGQDFFKMKERPEPYVCFVVVVLHKANNLQLYHRCVCESMFLNLG